MNWFNTKTKSNKYTKLTDDLPDIPSLSDRLD
jgi:hypothetical protein